MQKYTEPLAHRHPCGSYGADLNQPATSRSESLFRQNVCFLMLRLLQDDPTLSNREIARKLDVSVGGVHYCLKALADKGMIKIQNFRASEKKLHYVYIVTPSGISERARLAGRFLQRKIVEYEKLKAEIEAISEEVREHEGSMMDGPAA
jgi:EPS-associated MarR family transcriptional regulator